MAGLGNLVQKAFYMGVGLASYAGEKAGDKLQELRQQGQKLADELVKRGEMTADEATKFVDDIVKQAQKPAAPSQQDTTSREPRRIEILEDDEDAKTTTKVSDSSDKVDNLRQQVQSLQEELRRLQQD